VRLRRRLALTTLLSAAPLAALLLAYQGVVRRRAHVDALRETALSVMESGGRQVCEAFPTRFPAIGTAGPVPLTVEDASKILPLVSGLEDEIPPEVLDAVKEALGSTGEKPNEPKPKTEGPETPSDDGATFSAVLGPASVGVATIVDGPTVDSGVEMWAYHRDFRSSNPDAPPFPPGLRAAMERGDADVSDVLDVAGQETIRVAVAMPWREGPASIVLVLAPAPPPAAADAVVRWGLVAICLALVGTIWLAAGPVVARILRLEAGMRASAAGGYAHDVEVTGRDEVAGLARAFNEAGAQVRRHVAKVEEREGALRRFVADTTHDVMIPLTVLQGHLSDVRDHARRGEAVPPDAVRAGLEETHYLGSLLQNLSVVAKLEGGEPERRREPVDLGRLVERVVERHRPLARARSVSLDHAVPRQPLTTEGDVTLLEQAVNNVVHNAVRHNDDGGHVAVTLARAGDRFVLRVADDGPGVSGEDLERLGTRRFRSDAARTRDPGGRGLGLHIARRVAEHHGFDLAFRNRAPRGLEAAIEGPAVAPGATR
jgi:signal transduction histidine kinase